MKKEERKLPCHRVNTGTYSEGFKDGFQGKILHQDVWMDRGKDYKNGYGDGRAEAIIEHDDIPFR